jgi:hypothetical protein
MLNHASHRLVLDYLGHPTWSKNVADQPLLPGRGMASVQQTLLA